MLYTSIVNYNFQSERFTLNTSILFYRLRFDGNIAKLGGTYAKWNVFWPIPNGWYQCMRFYFQAQGKPRPAMYNNLMFLFINVLLNWSVTKPARVVIRVHRALLERLREAG